MIKFIIEFTMPGSGNKLYVGKPDSPVLALTPEINLATEFENRANAETFLQTIRRNDPNNWNNKMKISDCMEVIGLVEK